MNWQICAIMFRFLNVFMPLVRPLNVGILSFVTIRVIMTVVRPTKTGAKPKISNFDVTMSIYQHVVWFYVSVDVKSGFEKMSWPEIT